jgi:hypothetical protein
MAQRSIKRLVGAPKRRMYAGAVPDLILLRHGQSAWNELNLFTGWTDVDLTPLGESEARSAGELLLTEPDLDLRVLHTSVLTRAIRTAEITLHAGSAPGSRCGATGGSTSATTATSPARTRRRPRTSSDSSRSSSGAALTTSPAAVARRRSPQQPPRPAISRRAGGVRAARPSASRTSWPG